MAEIVFALSAVMSAVCTILLLRGYSQGRSALLLWAGLAFVFMTANNVVLFVDMIVLPTTDIGGAFWRNMLAAISGSLLLFGLIWEVG